MTVLVPRTRLDLGTGQEVVSGVFPISDQARSIKVSTSRENWAERSGADREAIEVVLEVSVDGELWQVDLYRSHGGLTMGRDGVTPQLDTSAVFGLRPGRNRTGRIRTRAMIALETFIAVDNSIVIGTPNSNAANNVSTLSVSVDAGTGSNRAMYGGYAGWSFTTTLTISTFTYNAVGLDEVGTATQEVSGFEAFAALHRLVAPATGANSLAVTTSDNADCAIGGVPLEGVDQGDPDDTAVTDVGTGNTQSVNVSSETDDLVVDVAQAVDVQNAVVMNVGASQTEQWSETPFGGSPGSRVAMSTEPGGASIAMGWSLTMGDVGDWEQVAVNVNAAGPGPALVAGSAFYQESSVRVPPSFVTY